MRLLLTLDGSAYAESAIPMAQQFAREASTEVHVLAVAEPAPRWTACHDGARPLDGVGTGRLPDEDRAEASVEDITPDAQLLLEHYLESVARLFPGSTVIPAVRVGPYPAAQIAAYAQSYDIDLIVMATHGRSGVSRAVHGSVAAQVVQSGVAPVALVRPAA
jgi:nucleotide-binding universal stress UspA family protein